MKSFTIVLCFFVFSNALNAQKNKDNGLLTENCVIDYIPFDIVEKKTNILIFSRSNAHDTIEIKLKIHLTTKSWANLRN